MFDTGTKRETAADLATTRIARAAGCLAAAQAEFYAAVCALAREASDDPDGLDEFAADEVGTALSLTRRAADATVTLAWALCVEHPLVWQALAEGRIDLARARVLVQEIAVLDRDTAADVAADILERAGSLTTGQLRARLRKMVIGVDPLASNARYDAAVEERRVTMDANTDGTANITAWSLPSDRASAAMRHLVKTAQRRASAGDTRTTDQLRADVFCELLESDPTGERRGTVDIRVDLATLIGLDDVPGDLAGYGPVVADLLRQISTEQHGAEWRAAVTHPDTNEIIWHGTTRRRPTVAQSRYIEMVKPTCVGPGCRMPAQECDLDHTTDWVSSRDTSVGNLAPLCRHHHRLKHEGGWQLRRTADDVYEWTTRLGQVYVVDPRGP